MISRRGLYWIFQAVGWSTYAALNALIFVPRGGVASLVSLVFLSGLGFALTHLLRAWARRRRWLSLSPWRLVPRALVASVLLAALTLLGLALAGALHRPGAGPVAWTALVGTGANFSALYLGWQLFYFGVHTLERARRAEADRWRLEAAAQAAELRFLKAQLDPHFLFNCLNSLGTLIDEDPARAKEAIGRLASLLRRALAAGRTEMVPLSEELEVVRDYLALQKIRFEERLTSRMEVGEPCLGARVPAMLLQSLVENGVKHGISKHPGGGEIAVVGRIEGDVVRLEVHNPVPSSGAPEASGGIGLANARERLRLLFGDRAAVGLAPSGRAMMAWVELPR